VHVAFVSRPIAPRTANTASDASVFPDADVGDERVGENRIVIPHKLYEFEATNRVAFKLYQLIVIA